MDDKRREKVRRIREILGALGERGYRAFLVGGSIRDTILGSLRGGGEGIFTFEGLERVDADTDIATSARPEEIKEVFRDMRTVDTGIAHGTVTVMVPLGEDVFPVELTTFRTEGGYSDNRHPDEVEFVSSIYDDLQRRDFTMNAIAVDRDGCVEDPFGGMDDIRMGVIRTVGDPVTRFGEDALRIMRALRFSSALGFTIEEETADALFECRNLMGSVSEERIFTELKKLVCGQNACDVVREYVDVLGVILPELKAMDGFLQNNPYHKYDVLEHCVRTMEVIETTPENREYMKLAALLHDVGKPLTYSEDEKGMGHFYGHPAAGAVLMQKILKRMKADSFTQRRVTTIVKYHDLIFDRDRKLVRKQLHRFGPELLKELLEIKIADNRATGNLIPALIEKLTDVRGIIGDVIEKGECYSLRDLAVDGGDMAAMGIGPGPVTGHILDDLLDRVMDERVPNEREALLREAESLRWEIDS